MEISFSEDKTGNVPVTVFHIRGDIDTQTSKLLETHAKEAFDQGVRRLLLDLSGVRYVSSAGLRAISFIFNMLRSANPEESDDLIKKGMRDGTYKSKLLKIAGANPSVAQVFALSGYDMFLELHKNQDEALRSF